MITIELPYLDLHGQWTVTPAERTLAGQLLAAMPPAPPPGSDVVTRWNAALDVLFLVRDDIREGGSALFAEMGGGPYVRKPGTVAMLDMCFAAAHTVNNGMWELAVNGPNGPDLAAMDRYLAMFEPDVTALRGYLAEAAADPA